jgi:hypothetical protein
MDVPQKVVLREKVMVGTPSFLGPYMKSIGTTFVLSGVDGHGLEEGETSSFDFDFVVAGTEIITKYGILTIPPLEYEPIAILHVPPGDSSSVTLEHGSTLSVSTQLTDGMDNTVGHESLTSWDTSMTLSNFEGHFGFSLQTASEHAWERTYGASTSMSITTTQSFTATNVRVDSGEDYTDDDNDLVISLTTPYKVSSENVWPVLRAQRAPQR